MTRRNIVVIGAGGFGREALDIIEAINADTAHESWQILGVVDDRPSDLNLERLYRRGIAYLGSSEEVRRAHPEAWYVVGIGSPVVRRRIAADFDADGWHAARLVHPRAVIGSVGEIGGGSVICGGAQLSTNTRLGAHVHLNPGSIIGHDTVLEEFVSVNPGAVVSGEVVVRPGVLVGAGAVILQGLTVGEGATIGAAACVIHSVGAGQTMVGVPARILERGRERS